MSKAINWKQFWVDMIGILIGITIAFQLQNWKDNRTNIKLKKQYLTSLSNDLDKDLIELQSLVDTLSNQKKMMDLLLNDLYLDIPSDSVVQHTMGMFTASRFNAQNTTYQSMTNSGDISLIRDFELRNQIIDLYQRNHNVIHIIDESHLNVFYDHIYPVLYREVVFNGNNQLRDTKFLKNPVFINLAHTNSSMLTNKYEAYKNALLETKRVKEKIDKRIN